MHLHLFKSSRVAHLLTCLLIFSVVVLSGCAQEQEEGPGTKVKGITEKGVKKIAEPNIKVKIEDGPTKELSMEEYIMGVVAGEMKEDWPVNAYGAQAILARTFAMRRLKEEGTKTISGSHKEAQAYKPQNITDEIKEAVKKTRGEVIMYEGDYINAWFHSSAAGQTTSAKVGLAYKKAEPEYITSVKSPDQYAPEDVKSWSATFTQDDISGLLKQAGVKSAKTIERIEIKEKDETKRAIDIKIDYDGGEKVMKAADFRKSISPDKLKSTLIKDIEKSGNKFTFKGSGYGHGVGMSQWGAYALAKDGKSPEEIIAHYFGDVDIAKKWD